MSYEEADDFMHNFDKWDAKHAKQDFLSRMEHKLSRKERFGRS